MTMLPDPPAEIRLNMDEIYEALGAGTYGITAETETSRPLQQEDWERLNETTESLLPHKALLGGRHDY